MNIFKQIFLLLTISGIVNSCVKEGITQSPDAELRFSLDTLRFDTVFTSTGSVTQGLKIFNDNKQGIRISSIQLGGGNSSFFAINADGISARDIRGLDIAAGDSIYLFSSVTIDPNNLQLPFIVRDSIIISYNGNQDYIQLEAYGQNARYFRNGIITADTRFTRELPYVILGGLQVDTGISLTIDPGTRLYMHADAPLIIDGSLVVNGTKSDSVVFTGDRLDKDYRDLPASWPGIYFRATSKSNQLTYARIINAFQAIVTDQPSANAAPKITMDACIIDNIYDNGITAINSSIVATNCLISNCGLNILLVNGGRYQFTHCTVASYSNLYLVHKKPVLAISNWDSTTNGVTTFPMQAEFTNSIFWGDNGTVENEVVVSKRGNTVFSVSFIHNMYKAKRDPDFSTLTNNIKNEEPLFDSISATTKYYDFHINTKPSPAINTGLPAGILRDLDGKPRDSRPDIGSYEKN